MKYRRLQTLCILVLQIILLLLCSCSEKEAETRLDYDFQLNMAERTDYGFADTKEGIFFVKDYYLYHMTEDLTAKPLCIRGGCLHDKDPGINVNCDAYVEQAKGLFHYDEHLFVFANTKRSGLCLTEYTLDGIFVKSVSVLPASAENMIFHRGNFYYSFVSDNTAALVKLNADDGKSRVIYKSRYDRGSLEPMLAYDKFVYIRECDLNDENLCCMLIYDTEKETMTQIETENAVIYDGKLLYNKNTDDSDVLWTARPDGSKSKESKITLNTGDELECAFGEFVISTSKPNGEDKVQRFSVYKDSELLFECSLENVDGRNWSTRQTSDILVSDEYIFFLMLMKNGEHVVIETDRMMFEQGIFEPHFLF